MYISQDSLEGSSVKVAVHISQDSLEGSSVKVAVYISRESFKRKQFESFGVYISRVI